MKNITILLTTLFFACTALFSNPISVSANTLNTNLFISNCAYRVITSPTSSKVYGSISRFGSVCESVREKLPSVKPLYYGNAPFTLVQCAYNTHNSFASWNSYHPVFAENTFYTALDRCPAYLFYGTYSYQVEANTLYPSPTNKYFHLSLCQIKNPTPANWWNIITRYALNSNPNPTNLCAADPNRSLIEEPRVINIYS